MIVAEVVRFDARRDDQIVEDVWLALQKDRLRLHLDIRHMDHHHGRVGLSTQNPANRHRDIAG
jgi:hypothetical protein